MRKSKTLARIGKIVVIIALLDLFFAVCRTCRMVRCLDAVCGMIPDSYSRVAPVRRFTLYHGEGADLNAQWRNFLLLAWSRGNDQFLSQRENADGTVEVLWEMKCGNVPFGMGALFREGGDRLDLVRVCLFYPDRYVCKDEDGDAIERPYPDAQREIWGERVSCRRKIMKSALYGKEG